MNNDLIKRSDVEQMLTALGGCDASDKEAEGWDKAIDAALHGLRKIESADKWIPCSENLPDPYESVLVTAKMEGDSHSLTYQGARTGCAFELSGVKNPEEYIVTVWQPEPEPWEGEYK